MSRRLPGQVAPKYLLATRQTWTRNQSVKSITTRHRYGQQTLALRFGTAQDQITDTCRRVAAYLLTPREQKLAIEHSLEVIETSAMSGHNVEQAFQMVAEAIHRKMPDPAHYLGQGTFAMQAAGGSTSGTCC